MTGQRCAGWVTVPEEDRTGDRYVRDPSAGWWRPRRCPLDLDQVLIDAGYSTHPECGPDEPWNPPRQSDRATPDLRVNETARPRLDLTFDQLAAEVGRARADAQAGRERAAAARLAAAGCTEHATGVFLDRWREARTEPEAG